LTTFRKSNKYLRQGDYVDLSVILYDCLCAASRKQLCMDLYEIFIKGRSWPSLKVILFWWWSGFIFTVIQRSQSPSKVISA